VKSKLVYWSPQAEESYLNTLSYILDQWSIKVATSFQYKVESLIEKIKTHNWLCPASDKNRKLRRCVITHQSSLVYRIKNDVIEIVAFFDNRSNHYY
jgi:plasmid stabilization system protein ParE